MVIRFEGVRAGARGGGASEGEGECSNGEGALGCWGFKDFALIDGTFRATRDLG